MPTKRFKIFQKIAQAQDATTTDTTTSTAPTTISGAPREVTVDTYFPTFTAAWGANFKGPVDSLLNTLNWTIFSLTAGQMDLESLKVNHFNADTSKYPDAFLTGVVGFASAIFNKLLNAGKPFTTKVVNKKDIIKALQNQITTNSKIPDTLNASFPQSFLQTKIGNFKPKVISLLTQLDALSTTQ